MAKLGQIVTIPTGSYCYVALESGEKVIVNHEQDRRSAGGRGRLTVDRLKLMGFSSETVFALGLDTDDGARALAALSTTNGGGAPAPPLRLFLTHLQGCRTVADVVARCRRLREEG